MDECIFCRKEGAGLICENELAKAFYDNFPVNKGHVLVVPKRHVATYFKASQEELSAINELIFEVKEVLDAEYQPDGYNVGINVGEAGGQTVFHLHVHVIPRYAGDVENPRGGIRKIKKSIVSYPLEDEADEKVYNKLVRDKIPAIIEASGKEPVYRVADEEEYSYLLKEKLWEEVREYSNTRSAEELADILQVLRSLVEDQGLEWQELESMVDKKFDECGGFEKRIFLERVKN
ncbi:HIT domain-containing protein [Dethiobacter alkaliphilus]|uniref:Histidine triad (HIT) protein n=1 Tax=Dethiobacter alkaliphilus AHT 1 TaxID=555088 RepID=C0GD45_DETAL|nr:HIT domain-containing protein [Dethiobacter alkaliphilus]EEG79130.1 histidine triad (HIT) protein [Dethiobacter alkaliphilus AHT 1]